MKLYVPLDVVAHTSEPVAKEDLQWYSPQVAEDIHPTLSVSYSWFQQQLAEYRKRTYLSVPEDGQYFVFKISKKDEWFIYHYYSHSFAAIPSGLIYDNRDLAISRFSNELFTLGGIVDVSFDSVQ